MRLTLRTLLAWLDNVLPPDEAAVLKGRVEESEFASTLVQRIRHIVRRQRLTAPKVDGKGLGTDPNSVAEYLDSTLASERVTEFERVCLESDVHLAEVAACHQILEKVLSQPAQISPELRSRIQQLPDLVASGHYTSPVEKHRASEPLLPEEPQESRSGLVMQPIARSADATPPRSPQPMALEMPPERPKPEVPDYLKPEPSQSRSQLLLMLGVMGIAAIVLFFMSPLGRELLPPWSRSPSLAALPDAAQNPDPVAPPTPTDGSAPPPAENVPANDPAEKGLAPVAETNPPPNKPPVEKVGEALGDKGLPVVQPEIAEKVVNKLAEKIAEKLANKSDPAVARPEMDTAPPAQPPPADTPPAAEKPTTPLPPSEPAPDSKSVAATEVGRFISDETLLARFVAEGSNWVRLPSRALITLGERFASLPVYRPQIALANGVQLTMAGEATFRFERGQALPVALVAEEGRYLLVTSGAAEASMELQLRTLQGVLSLPAADAAAAVEITSYLAPGLDPRENTPIPVVYIFALNGPVSWQSASDPAPITIEPDHALALMGEEKPSSPTPVARPAWIDARNTPTLDRDAAKLAESLLSVDRPLLLGLEEIANHRKIEVRVQVARCLAHLGSYESLMRHLAQEEYRSYAPFEIETLRSRIALGVDSALDMQQELEKLRGSRDSATLFRLLYGYSESQLVEQNQDEELVALLESSHADIRWLAFDNLRRITGVTNSYNPTLSPEKNRSALVRWTKMLKEDQIVYATRPGPPPLPAPAAAVPPTADK
jgi:hypothetical protein